MANLLSQMGNRIGQAVAGWLSPYIAGGVSQYDLPAEDLARRYAILRNYYNGDHTKQLKTKEDIQDDNTVQNFVGLAVDRSNSRLWRGGIQFNLPEGATAQQEYIDKVWDLNKKEIILFQYGLHGGVYGTAYWKICPDEMLDPYTDKPYPRLIAIDSEIVRIKPNPDDSSDVDSYVIEYVTKHTNAAGGIEAVAHREITRRARDGETRTDEYNEEILLATDTWVIEEWEQSAVYGNQWTLVSLTPWDYNFPPILHQKNLPSLRNCYGDSDIDDVINVQDRSNFVMSNTAKIVKFFANPITFIFGISAKGMKENKLDSAVGSLYAIPDKDAKAMNLEMSSDLASSRNLYHDLRQSVFDIAREVDMTSVADKLGALTNFALRVLYSDALDKNDTKRQLYGDALKELNRRLLVLANWTGEQSNPGKITWGEAMITNIKEEMEVDELALKMKVIDLETITKRYQSRYGVSWEDIQKRLKENKPEPTEQPTIDFPPQSDPETQYKVKRMAE
jgi:Phage portal protein, SPP1 Gp6-like